MDLSASNRDDSRDDSRILKIYLRYKLATPDTFSQKIKILDVELAKLNMKVRPGHMWKLRAPDGANTHHDGFGLETLDKTEPVSRYEVYKLRNIWLDSGARAEVSFPVEMLEALKLTKCCAKAIDWVEAEPGTCLCARRGGGGRQNAAAAALKRKREESLEELRKMRAALGAPSSSQ